MTLAGWNRVVRSSHFATTYLRAAIIVFALVSVVLCIPSVHMVLGITDFDALDQGIVVPKIVSGNATTAPLIGLLVVTVFAAAGVSFKNLHDTAVFATGVGSLRRPAVVHPHARLRRTIRSDASGNDDSRRARITVTATLRHAPAQPEGLSLHALRTYLSDEEGYPTHRHT